MIFLSSLFSAFYYLLSCYSRSHTACQKGLNTMLLFDPHFHSVIRSFIHLFVDSLLHSAYSFHSGTQTHTHSIYSKKSIVLRRIAAVAVAVVAVVTMPLFSISASFATKATLRQKKVQNTVRESLLHTQTHINTRER